MMTVERSAEIHCCNVVKFEVYMNNPIWCYDVNFKYKTQGMEWPPQRPETFEMLRIFKLTFNFLIELGEAQHECSV